LVLAFVFWDWLVRVEMTNEAGGPGHPYSQHVPTLQANHPGNGTGEVHAVATGDGGVQAGRGKKMNVTHQFLKIGVLIANNEFISIIPPMIT
jgi:hypothetical protein